MVGVWENIIEQSPTTINFKNQGDFLTDNIQNPLIFLKSFFLKIEFFFLSLLTFLSFLTVFFLTKIYVSIILGISCFIILQKNEK